MSTAAHFNDEEHMEEVEEEEVEEALNKSKRTQEEWAEPTHELINQPNHRNMSKVPSVVLSWATKICLHLHVPQSSWTTALFTPPK